MKTLVALIFLTSILFTSSARADQVCVNYNADGTCNTWEDPGSGGFTNGPQGGSCTCANQDANGNCSYWVGC